jgi:hypothetical protein
VTTHLGYYLRVARRLSLKANGRLGPLLDGDVRRWQSLRPLNRPFEADTAERHLEWALAWMIEAHRRVKDQGLPSKFSLGPLFGLGPPYPETTGYTVCTLITLLRHRSRFAFLPLDRVSWLVRGSLQFLLGTQLAGGAFSGGHALMKNHGRPSVFNTGQIMLGLCDALESEAVFDGADTTNPAEHRPDSGRLRESISRAAVFMTEQIGADGAFAPRFTYLKRSKTYYARAAYGLLRAGIVLRERDWIDSARRHFDWVVGRQRADGWIEHWGFDESFAVLHTIAYTLRGLIEAHAYFGEGDYADAVERALAFIWESSDAYPRPDTDGRHAAATPSHGVPAPSSRLPPAYLSADRRAVPELCVTGLSQLAIVVYKFVASTGANDPKWPIWSGEMIRATQHFQPRGFRNPLMNGVMPASWPLDGRYQPNDFIEWGTKFFMDTMLLTLGVPPDEIRG